MPAYIIEALKKADMNSIWGLAIKKVLDNPTDEKLWQLVGDLKDQCKDCPRTMKAILRKGYNTIINS